MSPTGTRRGHGWLGLAAVALFTVCLPTGGADLRLRSWTTREGLPHDRIEAIAQTPSGHLWLATPSGLVRFDGRDFHLIQVFGPGSQNAPQSLLTDSSGRLWMISRGGEIRYVSDGRIQSVSRRDDGPEFQARGLYTDHNGLFLATEASGRIWRLVDDTFQPWLDASAAGSEPGSFVGINLDRAGRIWARHGNALSWWSGEAWKGLTPPPETQDFSATKTGASHDGGMWIASRDALRKFSRAGWESLSLRFPRKVTAIQCLMEDRNGHLWLSTGNDGVWRFDITGEMTELGSVDGLVSPHVRQIFEDADGHIWIATAQGLSLLPRSDLATDLPAGVGVDRMVADETVLNPDGPFERDSFLIPRGTRTVTLHFSVVHFAPESPIRLRYRLEGVDSEWKLAGKDRSARYTGLPPGRHVLRLAASPAGNWDRSRETTVGIDLEAQPWQSWPLRAAATAFILVSVVAGYQFRFARLRRSRELQLRFSRQLIESQEAERQRIAAELHDSLGQQLLVIKNCARLGLREATSPESLRQYLQRVSDTSSECLDEVRTMARNLRPYQLDQMGLTKAIRALVDPMQESGGPRITTDLDDLEDVLPREWEIHVYRIVQEGLNNVLRHAHATDVTVHIDHIGPSLNLRIEDNGRGLEAPAGFAGMPGFGLTSIRERAALMKGECRITDGPTGGTLLTVNIPLPGFADRQPGGDEPEAPSPSSSDPEGSVADPDPDTRRATPPDQGKPTP